jgi:hypothetical protein
MTGTDIISTLVGCEDEGLTSPYLSTLDLPSAEGDIYVISDLHIVI